jgi:hypothetical protein
MEVDTGHSYQKKELIKVRTCSPPPIARTVHSTGMPSTSPWQRSKKWNALSA